jgi:hypothetical protein
MWVMELLRGIMHGRTIELDSEPGLPDGQPVTVVVQPQYAAVGENGGVPPSASLGRAFGAWAEDARELDEFLEWNRSQRRTGREEIDQ